MLTLKPESKFIIFSKALGMETEDDIHFLASYFFKIDDEANDTNSATKPDEGENKTHRSKIESELIFLPDLFLVFLAKITLFNKDFHCF